jgi:hypothetical protein
VRVGVAAQPRSRRGALGDLGGGERRGDRARAGARGIDVDELALEDVEALSRSLRGALGTGT